MLQSYRLIGSLTRDRLNSKHHWLRLILELVTLRCNPSGMCHTQPCFALKQHVMCGLYFWMVIHCFTPQLMAHLSSAFFFSDDFQFSFFTNSEETVEFLVLLYFFFSFLGCNWSRNLSGSRYSPKWTGIMSKSHLTVPSPEPDIFYYFHHGSPYSALLDILMYILLLPSFPLFLFNVLIPVFNIFSFPLPKPFFSVPCVTFPLCYPFLCLPLLPPSSFTQVVSQRFPQNSIGAVGSAMFLRFVNPAIVSPYEAGILDKKPLPRIERGLKLMSKVRLLNMMFLWCSWLEGT